MPLIPIDEFIEYAASMIWRWRWWRFAWINASEDSGQSRCNGRSRIIGRLFFKIGVDLMGCPKCQCSMGANMKMGCECYCHPYAPYVEHKEPYPEIGCIRFEQKTQWKLW